MISVGDEYSRPYTFSLENIQEFAELSGDHNPLHSDPEIAAKSRFGGIIASGPHMSAVLMGVIAAQTARLIEGVGLDFHFRFRKAIPAGTETLLSWTITGMEPHAGLKGDLLTLSGRIADTEGTVYVTCEGHSVSWPKR